MALAANQLPTPNDIEPLDINNDTDGRDVAQPQQTAEPETPVAQAEEETKDPPREWVDDKRNKIFADARKRKAESGDAWGGDEHDMSVRYGNNVNMDDESLGDLEREALARQRKALQREADAASGQNQNQQQEQPAQQQRKPLNGIDPNILSATVSAVIDGVERQITVEEAVRHYQMQGAADKRLAEAQRILSEAKQTVRETRAPNDDDQRYDQYGEDRQTSQPQAEEYDVNAMAERLQFGTQEEAAEVLQQVLGSRQNQGLNPEEIEARVNAVLDQRQLRQSVSEYAAKNPEILQDPLLNSVIKTVSLQEMANDLLSLGIQRDQLDQAIKSEEDLRNFHRTARANGLKVRSAIQILEAAHKSASDWKSGQRSQQSQQPAQRQQPEMSMQDRAQRKQQITPQPARRQSVPAQPQPVVTAESSRQSAVNQMLASRKRFR